MKKQQFIRKCLPLARKAGKTFGLNPVTILSQAALESGWGTSTLAVKYNNYFGICGFGQKNDYWNGDKIELGNHDLKFRVYADPLESYMDYCRLIKTTYRSAAAMSDYPEAFAKEIAYSPYISEVNGDNREAYRKALVSLSREIEGIIDLIDNTFPSQEVTEECVTGK